MNTPIGLRELIKTNPLQLDFSMKLMSSIFWLDGGYIISALVDIIGLLLIFIPQPYEGELL